MLTRSGLGALLGGIVLVVAGLVWQYQELVAVGLGVSVVVALSAWAARRPFRAVVRRQLSSPRVARGEPLRLTYRCTNLGKRRTTAATIIDTFDGGTTSVELGSLAPDQSIDVRAELPTRRRGTSDVGPWRVDRVDPFGLAMGSRESDQIATVIVHPRVHQLAGPHGSLHTVEQEAVIRQAAADPLSGFVSLREYVQGDDPRLIHWPTTARTGTLMVREHIELRRPEFTVVLDTATHAATPEDFEEAVDVAASVAVHAIGGGLDVVVRTTSRQHPGPKLPQRDHTRVLDLLTPVQQTTGNDLLAVAALFASGYDHSAVLVITGPSGPSSSAASRGNTMVVRVGEGAVATTGIVLAVADAREFARRWRSAR